MSPEDECPCEEKEKLLFSCAGASNVGQIANSAAIELARVGEGRYFCLAGVSEQIKTKKKPLY